MSLIHFHRTRGSRAFVNALIVLLVAGNTSCIYGFRGGGGFPADIHTMFIETFENSTSRRHPPGIDRGLSRETCLDAH